MDMLELIFYAHLAVFVLGGLLFVGLMGGWWIPALVITMAALNVFARTKPG
jgi:hypothetical protein